MFIIVRERIVTTLNAQTVLRIAFHLKISWASWKDHQVQKSTLTKYISVTMRIKRVGIVKQISTLYCTV